VAELDVHAFARLFEEVCEKCFARAQRVPLTETECHHLSVEIAESTGREIGWKSLKNYSQFVFDPSLARRENPSAATLETLARYAAGVSGEDDSVRAKGERHYPYWFRFQEALRRTEGEAPSPTLTDPALPTEGAPPASRGEPPVSLPNATSSSRQHPARARLPAGGVALLVLIGLALVATAIMRGRRSSEGGRTFVDEFQDVGDDALAARGWWVQAVDSAHWSRRAAEAGTLTLFTLAGDNWPQPGTPPRIANLVLRRSPPGCFIAEVRFTSFVPTQNWQQAGLLILEDTAFVGRSVRLSIGYNDFSAGFPGAREIIAQGVASLGQSFNKPEELVHQRLFTIEPGQERAVADNLASAAVRIERRRHGVRLLYSAGPLGNAAFKEIAAREFDFEPAFIGIFALKGFVDGVEDLPVRVNDYRETAERCVD